MAETGLLISELKMKAYDKVHIPTKDEVMDEIITIGKIISDSSKTEKSCKDIKAVFIESNNGDLEFFGFVGDFARRVDTQGNPLHIGDSIEFTLKGGYKLKQTVLNIIPKQKTINLNNGVLYRPYTEMPDSICSRPHGIFHYVSCLNEYLKSMSQSDSDKGSEGVI